MGNFTSMLYNKVIRKEATAVGRFDIFLDSGQPVLYA